MTRISKEEISKLFKEVITTQSVQKAHEVVLLAEKNHFLDLAYFLRAFIEQLKNNYEEAIQLYKDAIEVNPGFRGSYNGIGNCYLALKNYDKAIKWYNEYIKTFNLANLSVPFHNRALVYAEKKEYEKAISSSLMSIEHNKSYSRPYLFLLNTYFTLSDISSAIRVADEILKVFEKDQEVLKQLARSCSQFGFSLEKSGDMEGANLCYDRASKASPAYFHVLLSSRYLEEKTYKKALDAINKALDTNPTDPGGLYNLACYYSLQKKKKKAIDTLRKVIEIQPDLKDKAKKDTDFDYLKQFAEFRELVGDLKTKLSRKQPK